MAEEPKIESTEAVPEVTQKTRRTFVKTAAQVAVTAPAVGILLSASTKPAAAQTAYFNPATSHVLDDYTFGNAHEDIDGTNPAAPGTPSLDDGHV